MIGVVSLVAEAAAAAAVFWHGGTPLRRAPAPRRSRRTSAVTAAATAIATMTCARSQIATTAAPTPATRASTVISSSPPNVCVTTSAMSMTGASRSTTDWTCGGSERRPISTGPAALKAMVATPTTATTIQALLTTRAIQR